jgi:hypothetical protein
MSHIRSQSIEITKMFDLLNKLTHIRRRILFGDTVRFTRWLMDQGVEVEDKEANVSNLKIIKFY